MPLRVALAAQEAAGVQALRLLVARGHEVVTVLTGSGAGGPGASVAGVARGLGLAVRPAKLVRDPALARDLRDVDLLLNVHSLCVADPEVIAAPRLGAFNLHPGPLPEYAGLHAVNWAIYEGERCHGVTLHRMAADVDAGDVAFAARFPIGADDTGLAVTIRCTQLGLSLVERLLLVAERRQPIPAIRQDLSRRRWFGAGPPDGGRLHWDRPAARVANLVRAADYRPLRSPWGAPGCSVGGREVEVLAVRRGAGGPAQASPGTVGDRDGERVAVAASDDWVWVERVRTGGRDLPPAEVLRPGQRLSP